MAESGQAREDNQSENAKVIFMSFLGRIKND